MRARSLPIVLALALVPALGGCSTLGLGGGGEEDPEIRRAACDRLAAQAIDAEDVGEARRLAARASDCYAEELQRRE